MNLGLLTGGNFVAIHLRNATFYGRGACEPCWGFLGPRDRWGTPAGVLFDYHPVILECRERGA